MELLFLYVFDFRKIKKQAFAFSADLQFTVTEEGTDKNPRINILISESPDYVNIFPENILNATGIIGKNGAGKSTLIDCLKLLGGNISAIRTPLIFSVRDQDKGIIYTCYYDREVHEGALNEWVTVRFSRNHPKKDLNLITRPYWLDLLATPAVQNLPFDLREINTCFFTNAFHSHSEASFTGIFNLSTNARLDRFMKSLVEERISEDRKRREREIEPLTYELSGFHKIELRSMLSFLSYAKERSTHKIPDLPETLVFKFNFDDLDFLMYDMDSRFRGSVEELKMIHDIALEQIRATEDYVQAFNKLVILCTYYYLLKWEFVEDGSRKASFYEYMEDSIHDPGRLFENLLRTIERFSYSSKRHIMLVHELRDGLFGQLRRMRFEGKWDRKNITDFTFQIDNRLWPVLSRIHDIIDIEHLQFITYEWGGGLSTGQEAFISHFSRLHDIKRKVGSKPIWLLIDEGDLHFHPEMQKEYFSQLLTFVGFLFSRNQVQIILSTHSPFIVSDLPKQNLIFLKNGAAGNCEVDSENIKQDTFGANIHDLFKDSLFLSGSLMGDYAKSKIDEIINWCNDPDENKRSLVEYYRSLVNVIGEPIIKMKLSEMIAKKMGEDQELARLQEQEIYIRRRIVELKSKNDQNQK
nr:AAA family ATPase [Pedobacter sp. ASV19]